MEKHVQKSCAGPVEYHVPINPSIQLARTQEAIVRQFEEHQSSDPVSSGTIAGLLCGAIVGGIAGLLMLGGFIQGMFVGATAGLIVGMATGLMRHMLELKRYGAGIEK